MLSFKCDRGYYKIVWQQANVKVDTIEYCIIEDREEKVAHILSLSREEYRRILCKHNAHMTFSSELWFNSKGDGERAMEDLEPYVLMRKLIE